MLLSSITVLHAMKALLQHHSVSSRTPLLYLPAVTLWTTAGWLNVFILLSTAVVCSLPHPILQGRKARIVTEHVLNRKQSHCQCCVYFVCFHVKLKKKQPQKNLRGPLELPGWIESFLVCLRSTYNISNTYGNSFNNRKTNTTFTMVWICSVMLLLSSFPMVSYFDVAHSGCPSHEIFSHFSGCLKQVNLVWTIWFNHRTLCDL